MREIPECLNRRYQALDELIRELSMISSIGSQEDYPSEPGNDPGVKLMCDFWNILKEDPDCNLTQVVRERMGLRENTSSRVFRPQHVKCYMACCNKSDEAVKKSTCDKSPTQKSPEQKSPDRRSACCTSTSVSPKSTNEAIPLSKVLCNLKEAVSFDKKCNIRIGELMMAEKKLQEQIQHLEQREKEGIQMLKKADCMWSCMEEAYKKKIAESLERQGTLLKQMTEVETSNNKWRKNKKDLEFQLNNINQCHQEITEKIHEKTNDINCIKREIEDFKKRIESNKKDTAAVQKSFGNKKTASDAKVASLSAEMARLKKSITDENEYKQEKENEGNQYIKEARDDLKKICKVLLQKKLENEDLHAEKEALLQEIEILKKTTDLCRNKCQDKQKAIIDEIAKVDEEIAGFKVRCIRCHKFTDTADVRKFCNDCPRCAEERDCLIEGSHCILDSAMDCVCMSTKQKFLDNVFDNMYTVLEREAKTCQGKAVAEQVLNCLKKSRNGKLNEETRKILQDFILITVKKNLNLTIIGGAVKTRCEMDPEAYKQLMLCLKQVKTVKATKVDKGTPAKKDPCRRWGGASECNCPKGPKACICTKKAPPPPNDPDPCPPPVDKEDAGEVMVCPHKESTPCGPDCAMHGTPNAVGTEVASWRPAPCDEKQCFSKNMRAAQCVLGPDCLSTVSRSKEYKSATPLMPNIEEINDQITCKRGPDVAEPCSCRKELKSHPRERIIEEVMGRYTDVMPIEKVSIVDEEKNADKNMGRKRNNCGCLNKPITKIKRTPVKKINPLCVCTSSLCKKEKYKPYCKRLSHIKQVYLSRRNDDFCSPNEENLYKIFPGFQFECNARCVIGINNRVKKNVLTCPKHGKFELVDTSAGSSLVFHESQVSLEDITRCVQISEESSSKEKSVQNSGISLFGRVVCDTVKELIKAVIVSDTTKAKNIPSDVQWMTVESFLNEISSLTRSKETSSATVNEVEIASELLSDTNMNLNAKYKLINMLILQKSNKNQNCFLGMKKNMGKVVNHLFVSESYRDSAFSSKTASNDSSIKPSNSLEDYSHDDKTLTVDVGQCEKGTCAIIWERATEEVAKKETVSRMKALDSKASDLLKYKREYVDEKNEARFNKKKETKENRTKKRPKHIDTMRVGLVNKNVKFRGPHPDTRVQKNKCVREDDFKVSIENRKGHSDHLSKLANTPSGSLAMELDEKIIQQIEQKIEESNKLTVSLQRTASGHMHVDFSPSDDPSCSKQKVLVKRSLSGSLVFEVNKSFVGILKSDINIDNTSLELDNNTSVSVVIKPKKQVNYLFDKNDQKTDKVDTNHVCRLESSSKQSKAKDNEVTKIKENVDTKCNDAVIKITQRNGAFAPTKATVVNTKSGNMAFIVNDTSGFGLLGEIISKCKEHPVLLSESDSGSYILDFHCKHSNAMMRKTLSGKILIVKLDPAVKLTETNESCFQKKCDEVFKISVKNPQQKVANPPVVLKSTPSNNYIVVVDKEYEKRYKKTVKDHLESNYECPVELVKTSSGNFILNFRENGEKLNANARLERSLSGNIKIDTNSDNKQLYSNERSSSKALDDLINSLSETVKKSSDEVKPRLLETKSSSDSNLYEKVKIRLQNHQNLILKPSALLKKTSSGQYAVVLNKESKKTFINNLKSYLASNTQDLIPIKRTDSGEITIMLNNENDSKGQYGSLKITPSGNIYVSVDEKVIRTMAKSVKIERLHSSASSSRVIQEINPTQNPVNKKIATTCNANPDSCSCDPSKCICAELMKHCVDTNSEGQSCFKFCQQKDEEFECSFKNCGCGMCPKSCISKFNEEREKSPHIVIKSCCCKPEPKKKLKSNTRPLYFVTEEVCPFHKHRYESVSNELLEISGLCNNNDKSKYKYNYVDEEDIKICTNQVSSRDDIPEFRPSNLDYLDFLPPQLPYFLRDFRCT